MSLTDTDEQKLQNVKLIQNLDTEDEDFKSPINFNISYMKVIELNPLEWNSFDIPPRKLKVTNTGYIVVLSAKWQEDHPYITSGPLTGNYSFSQFHFHWGKNEMEGSEHTIDGASMPMELHAVLFKAGYPMDLALRKRDGITILVYFFKLQDEPNEFMDGIIQNLSSIRTAHSSVRIVPESLMKILRPFENDYFLYWGPIRTITNVHTILWLISRVPIGITAKQIAEFRKLSNERNEPILSNLRPLQETDKSKIFHVCPSGSMYASLLPLPRDVIPKRLNTVAD